jgi:hypothetical protein
LLSIPNDQFLPLASKRYIIPLVALVRVNDNCPAEGSGVASSKESIAISSSPFTANHESDDPILLPLLCYLINFSFAHFFIADTIATMNLLKAT